MKKLLLLLMTAIVTVGFGSCSNEAVKCKNCVKQEKGSTKGTKNTYTNTDKNGRINRKCPDGECPTTKRNGRYNTMQKERTERRW